MMAPKPGHEFEVVVVGAGPSGAATALRLAELGHHVAIVEQARFPRSHVGICLSDQTLALLEFLGLQDAFRAFGFWRRRVTRVNWGVGGAREVDQRGFHVDRGQLDQSLLQRACEAGAVLFQPARIVERKSCPARGWLLKVGHEQDRSSTATFLAARFLVDASGRRSTLGGKRIIDSEPLLALHADWTFETAPQVDGLIEADGDGWLWFAQTGRKRGEATVFLDPRQTGEMTRSGLEDWYLNRVARYSLPAKTGDWRLASSVSACDATSTHAAKPVTDRHLQVGDAAMAVDPLASQGVHLALLSALQAAVVVHTILRKPGNTEAAKSFCRAQLNRRVAKYTTRTGEEYARVAAETPTAFWLNRSHATEEHANELITFDEPPSQITLSPAVQIETASVIAGSLIEERRIVSHPHLEAGVKYLGGFDLVPLLDNLPASLPYQALADAWHPFVPASRVDAIATWLLERGLLRESFQGHQ